MANVKVLLWFDVEDYITPESQDAWAGLLQELNKRNVTGIFKIVGEKARLTQEQNRTDILSGLARHEIGYHSDLHSQHPVSTEYLEHLGFREGADLFVAKERKGFEDLLRITGSPVVSYGQAGYSWAPQTFAALHKWGIPVYLDDHDQISLNGQPFWYGGLLNFTNMAGILKLSFKGDRLEQARLEFDRLYEEFSERLSGDEVGFISMYCHECDFVCDGYWDVGNFARGKETPRAEWRPAPLKPAGEMEHWLGKFGEFLDHTLSKSIEYITAGQALELECSRAEAVTEGDVRALAATVGEELGFRVLDGKAYSASELHALFGSLLLGRELKADFAYGPEREFRSDDGGPLRVADLMEVLGAAVEPEVLGFRQLPDFYEVAGRKISALDLTCTLARVITLGLRGEDSVELVRGVLVTRQCAGDDDLWGRRWRIFPEDFRAPNVVRMSKLQTWTLKPALFANK
ncbi:hypothetical protein ACFFNY_17690 [Paenibacillus hodogayensis]|uniref:NodB homology domain-containing protein n=1 Tax=Paenibacillus hodogayensis TaxID=279208 RepID=A0ABV5VYW1_9BACL